MQRYFPYGLPRTDSPHWRYLVFFGLFRKKKSRQATRGRARCFDPHWLHSSGKKPRHLISQAASFILELQSVWGRQRQHSAATLLICHISGILTVPPSFITNSSFLSWFLNTGTSQGHIFCTADLSQMLHFTANNYQESPHHCFPCKAMLHCVDSWSVPVIVTASVICWTAGEEHGSNQQLDNKEPLLRKVSFSRLIKAQCAPQPEAGCFKSPQLQNEEHIPVVQQSSTAMPSCAAGSTVQSVEAQEINSSFTTTSDLKCTAHTSTPPHTQTHGQEDTNLSPDGKDAPKNTFESEFIRLQQHPRPCSNALGRCTA